MEQKKDQNETTTQKSLWYGKIYTIYWENKKCQRGMVVWKRYVALLRGINISGKNKIAMSELKAGFAELGYTAVSTYLNSGNVVFCADIDDKEGLSNEIRSMINKRFGLDIPVFVVSQEELEDILKNAPEWWGDSNKEIYDNLIFMFPNISYDSFYNEVGNPKEEYEKIYHYKKCDFLVF